MTAFFSVLRLRRASDAPSGAGAAEDAARIVRALAGDRRAYDELYDAHVDAVFRRVTRLVGAVADRDDLVQQAFLDAFRALPRFRGDASFRTFLHRIVLNVSYDHLRRRREHVGLENVDVETGISAHDALSPETVAGDRELVERALRHLEALKPVKRIAFVLRVIEGLSLEEIAELVGATPAAVGQRVRHAQSELQAMMERETRRRLRVGVANEDDGGEP